MWITIHYCKLKRPRLMKLTPVSSWNPTKDAPNVGEVASHVSSDDNIEPTLEGEIRSETPEKEIIKIENLRTSDPVAPMDDPKGKVFSNLD